MNAGNLSRVVKYNYLLGGVLVIGAALTQPRDVALGIAVGVALTCLNFFLLGRLVTKWTRDAAAGKPTSGSAMLMMPKMIGLMGLVVLSLWLLPIDAAAFAIGYSIFVISIFVELILSAVRDGRPENDPESHHG